MTHPQGGCRVIVLSALLSTGMAVSSAASAFGVQAPQEVPVTHERQCVPTGQISPGSARTITVTWKHPFATGEYDVVGSVSESGESAQDIELGHIVIPHTSTAAAATVFNRSANTTQAGILCLDATAE